MTCDWLAGCDPTLLHTNQEPCGFIEKVTSTDPPAKVHYLPHHPVKKDSATTPKRIIYDCSSRQSKEHASLGPPFLNNLCSIILRFRLHKFAFATNLEKAFYTSGFMNLTEMLLDFCGFQTSTLHMDL